MYDNDIVIAYDIVCVMCVTGGAELLVGGEQGLDGRDALLREPVAAADAALDTSESQPSKIVTPSRSRSRSTRSDQGAIAAHNYDDYSISS